MAGTTTRNRRRRPSVGQIAGAVLVLIVLVALLRWAGVHWYHLFWFRAFVDGTWEVYDYSIDRLRGTSTFLAALSPFLLGRIAYRAYQNTLRTTQSERWWQRAVWALDASTDDSPLRQHMGKKVLARLKKMDIA